MSIHLNNNNSNNNMELFKALGIESNPEKAEEAHTKDEAFQQNWIKRGILIAHAIELLSEQFQHISAKKKQFVTGILKSEKESSSRKSSWQRLIKNIIQANAMSKIREISVWAEYNEEIETSDLRKEELLGLSLYMAKVNNIEGAISGSLRLLKRKDIRLKEVGPRIYLELIRFFSEGKAKSDQNTTSSEWIKEIHQHIDLLNIVSMIASLDSSLSENETLKTHQKIIQILEKLYISHREKPTSTSKQSWELLQRISYRNVELRFPELVFVESQSLPRSGHHYLKDLLSSATKDHFSYCESYQEPGCCKSNPCNINAYWNHAINKKQHHYRLVKSHDFELDNKTFNCMPGMYRIIQIRDPFDLLVSWLELAQLGYNKKVLKENNIDISRIYLYHETALLEESWETIDMSGRTMKSDEAEDWLHSKKKYIKSFLSKWIPISNQIDENEEYNCGNFVLHYENLKDPKTLLNLLRIKNYDENQLPRFRQRRRSILTRKSKRVERLCQKYSGLVREICNEIKDSTPLLENGNNVWR